MKSQLKLGVWLTIVGIVIYIPTIIFYIVGENSGEWNLSTLAIILNTSYILIWIYLYLLFKKLLNNYIKTDVFDISIISLTVILSVTGLLSILYYFNVITQEIDTMLEVILFVISGIITLVMGIKMRALDSNLYEKGNALGWLFIFTGICYATIILAPIGIFLQLASEIVFATLLNSASETIE